MIPDPPPVDGICPPPRDENPSEVIVTTESRTAATTLVRSISGAGAGDEPVPTVTAAGAGGRGGAGGGAAAAARPYGLSGPATGAAVPPAARTADRTAAATTDPAR